MPPLLDGPLTPRQRNVLFFSTPTLWPTWPFLPVVRRQGSAMEYGVLFDALAVCQLTGYGCTVFLTNLFQMPARLDRFLVLPREAFDTFDELAAAGWTVD